MRQIRQMGISNISEDRMTYGCAPTMSVTDNIIADRYYSGKYSHGIRLDVKAIRHDVEELVKTFDVVCPGTASMSGMLSGGNIQKMIAAREFTSGARVIVANQPTRGIDVGSSEFIHQQLVRLAREQDAAVLLVSADLTELLQPGAKHNRQQRSGQHNALQGHIDGPCMAGDKRPQCTEDDGGGHTNYRKQKSYEIIGSQKL